MSKVIDDYKKIMSVNEEMLAYDAIVPSVSGSLNPWVKQLPGIFRGLHLKRNLKVLDLACGEGGVSIPLAVNYGARIYGYDVKEEFIVRALNSAKRRGVSSKCTFSKKDIRRVINKEETFDIILWIAPPHIWKNLKSTIKAFKKCCKPHARIIIGDGYLYNNKFKRDYPEYQTLEDITNDIKKTNTEIEKFYDYADSLWDEDYERERKRLKKTYHKIKDKKIQKIIQHQIERLGRDEKNDKKMMGLGIWILRVNM